MPDAREAAIFEAARGIETPEARRRYVQQACGDDRALQDRVEGLLRMLEEDGNFLESPAAGVRAAVANLAGEAPGTRIGPYRLVEQLGEGGFGVVFLAEQTEPVRRQVALKVIKPGMDTRQVLARFEAERQALALMDHPHIARMLDGGETAAGRPYFVMELARGVPITDFCDQHHLPVRRRLELFLSVCSAVQHAHTKGVIHRDLKPSNVLVMLQDGTPVVKVIDFGVAKALGQKLTDRTLVTNLTQLVGTPLYMSPEQAEMSGADLDTRTDVYSLGVLLYELLTGTTPFDRERLRAVAFDEVRRIIREEEPARPSARITTLAGVADTMSGNRRSDPKRLRRLFRGDLDWIVMRCLEKDRTRRYETASELAADVRHYLADEPVLAGPPSAAYRLRKYARKYRKVLATAAAFAALLVAATVSSIALASWALRERNHAEEQKQAAEANFQRALHAVDNMLTRVGEVQLSHVPHMEPVRRDLLQDALRFYQQFLRERGDSPVVRAEAARAYRRVGQIQALLGHWDEGEEAYGQAAALLERLVAESPGEPSFLNELAGVHSGLGLLYHSTRRWPQAEASLRQAVALLERLEREQPTLLKNRHDLVKSQCDLVALYRQMGRLGQAETAFLKGMTLLDRLLADDPGNVEALTLRARCYQNMALVYGAQGHTARAEEACRKALALNEGLVRDQPEVVDHRRRLAHTYNNLGLFYARQGRHDEAEAAYQQSLAHKEALLRDHPRVVAFMVDLASGYGNLATEVRRRSPEEALEWAARATRLLEPVLEKDPRYVEARMCLFDTLMGRAYALGRLGRPEDAAREWRRVVEVSEGQPHINMRLYRPLALAFLGEHARAAAEIETLLAEGHTQGRNLFLFAQVLSLGSAAAAKDVRVPTARREELADEYGGRAVELLRRAQSAGYFRDPAQLARLKEHKNLDAIRSRPDFKGLLVELEKPRSPGPRPESP